MSFASLDSRDPERREGFGLWWLGSLALHGALFAWLLILNPAPRATEMATGASAGEITTTAPPERIQQVVEEIRERQVDAFEERLAELNEAKHDVETAALQKLAQYSESISEVAGELPNEISSGQQQVEAAQDGSAQSPAGCGSGAHAVERGKVEYSECR